MRMCTEHARPTVPPAGRRRVSPFRHSTRLTVGAILLIGLLAAGCGAGAERDGLRRVERDGGARVTFDLEERPFPEIPFPNDLATRTAPDSPTGRRLNVSTLAPTDLEETVRRHVNELDGFGAYAPITVSFDKPLDLRNILRRHAEPTPDRSDDAVYLVNVDRDSPGFGTLRMLDLGRGNFPVTLSDTDQYFAHDPRSEGTNLILESERETDDNLDGELDPIEDTDSDGRWDKPNVLDRDGKDAKPGEVLTFYERETNTLMIRSLKPLRPQTTYAVVLTSALRDAEGEAVESPFPTINHLRQTDTLRPLKEILPSKFPERFTSKLEDVQFTWAFTTQSQTRDLRAIRKGLYGKGPFARFQDQYPARLQLIHNPKTKDAGEEPLTIDINALKRVLVPAFAGGLDEARRKALSGAMENLDYLVSGSYETPYFLTDRDGLAKGKHPNISDELPHDRHEVFDVDPETGRATVGRDEVTWQCAVPDEDEVEGEQPFPVAIYGHGYGSSRIEMLGFAGQLAKFGIASCAIDNAGHGLRIPDSLREDEQIQQALKVAGLGNLVPMLKHGRARDLNNDGRVDPGGDYWTADTFHTRDMVRQTTVDYMQFVRILRSFDGQRRWPDEIDEDDPFVKARRKIVAGWDQNGDGKGELAGDFNGDGTVDFGGEQPYAAWGQSLGGIQSAVLAGIEPAVRAAAPVAGGAGMVDIGLRSTQGGVPEAVILRMLGPLLIGEPVRKNGEPTGKTRLYWIVPDVADTARLPIATVSGLKPGDRVVLRNLARERRPELVPEGEMRATATVRRNGTFRLSLAMDAVRGLTRRAKMGFDPNVHVGDLIDERNGGGTLSAAQKEQLERHTITNPREWGDPLVIEFADRTPGGEEPPESIATYREEFAYQNVRYPAGSPLAAPTEGWGLKRQTPQLRRFLGIAQMILGPADPGTFARTYYERPLDFSYDPKWTDGTSNVLVVPTIGDSNVPVNTGISIARSAGVIGYREKAKPYRATENQFLIRNYVYEGIPGLDRFPSHPGTLFDPDDLDRGQYRDPDTVEGEPPNVDADHPLRATVETETGVTAMRLPYVDPKGSHGFDFPSPDEAFDVHSFMTNQIGLFFSRAGSELSDAPCLQDVDMSDCDFFDTSGGSSANSE